MIDSIIDLYHEDDVEDWDTVVKGGVPAVIHKASEGIRMVDEKYALRRKWAADAGLPLWGAYHFATGDADGANQADHFLAAAQPDSSTLIALDLEKNPNGPSVTLATARAFIQRIHAVTGRFPWVYGSDFIADFAGEKGDSILSLCRLWIARYGRAPIVPPGWKTWDLWQYAEGVASEHLPALPGLGLVDRSKFNGTLDELKAIWSK